MTKGRILIIDDEPNIGVTLKSALELEGYEVHTALDGPTGLKAASATPFSAVLLDLMMPDLDGLTVLKTLKDDGVAAPVIMMSGHGTIESAVQATKLGAFDFVEKPLSLDLLLLTLNQLHTLSTLAQENLVLKEGQPLRHELVGGSAIMKRLLDQVLKVATSPSRVLITGENGVGKELVARAIHENSDRRAQPFLKLNCAAIPDNLLESELFGYEKGAFTGAAGRKLGKFELADHGTLFLDEIGDMSLSAQAKVLRVLQEGEFERVGGHQPIRVDVRVIAATNKDLKKGIADKSFREDLYYRLSVVPLQVPPLRERREDIPDLAKLFLARNGSAWNKKTRGITPRALALLQRQPWPGNVRELQNVMERLLILSSADPLDASDLETVLGLESSAPHSSLDTRHSIKKPYQEYIEEMERTYIRALVDEEKGNMSSVARRMGIERSHLYKKLKALGLQDNRL